MAALGDGDAGAPQATPTLADFCLQAALAGEYWRVQRRQLAWLPEEAANALLAGLLAEQRVQAPQLALFQHSVTVVEVDGSKVPSVGADWLSYLAKFRALRKLRLPRCPRLRDTHLSLLAPLAPTLRTLSLAGCTGLTAGAGQHLALLTSLESLDMQDTHMGPPAVRCLTPLTALTALRLGGLPTSDDCCIALARLSNLRRLELWGSEVSDQGMRELEHLSGLTALDLSLTRCASPALLPMLCHLSMIHCQLDVVGKDREALWMDMGGHLPALEELQLQSATFQQPRGAQLLQQLVMGAAGTLRCLRLDGSNVADLAFLAHATALTRLDLAGAPVHDSLLGSLALLPLQHLSLADTGVTDEGIGQLLALTTIQHLDLRNSQAGDGALGVLAQLPQLAELDLSGTEFAGNLPSEALPGPLPALTSLSLLSSRLADRGCRLLARATPALQHLQLGSAAVTDAGLKSLAKLSALTSLKLEGCQASDHGLAYVASLPRLQQLQLDNCWLLSEEGVRQLLARLPRLESLQLNGIAVERTPAGCGGAGSTGSPAGGRAAQLGRGARRRPLSGGATPRSGATAAATSGRARPGSGKAGLGPSTAAAADSLGGLQLNPSEGSLGGGRFGRLPEELLQYDERLRYSREELLELQQDCGAGAAGGAAAGAAAALLAALPADLARGRAW